MPAESESFKRAVVDAFGAGTAAVGEVAGRGSAVCACGALPQPTASRTQARDMQQAMGEGSCTERYCLKLFRQESRCRTEGRRRAPLNCWLPFARQVKRPIAER